MQQNDYIFTCIIEYFKETISSDDATRLEAWRNESADHEKEFIQTIRILDYAERINQISHINSVKDLKLVKKRFPKNRTSGIRQLLRQVSRYAAVLSIPLLISTFWGIFQYQEHQQLAKSVVIKDVQTASGVRTKLTLSDGTQVWLNSGSKLTYPEAFVRSIREVTLVGEGYFKVKSDLSHPFYVHVGSLSVKATGTAFNITNYPNETLLQVTLEQGKLELVKQINTQTDQQICRISEGEMVKYDPNSNLISLKKVDVNKYISWVRGKLIFRNDKMDEVITRIGRQYNAEIQLEGDELSDYRYTATFEDETLYQILDLLKYSSPITYTIQPRKKLDDESFSKPKIIIKASKSAKNKHRVQ